MDESIQKRLSLARKIYRSSRAQLEAILADDLIRYRRAIEITNRALITTGIAAICATCPDEDGQTCCGRGLERHVDLCILVLNLLLGVSLPGERELEQGCFFVGPKGCKILARPIICRNHLCLEIKEKVPLQEIIYFQNAWSEEAELTYLLSEKIRHFKIFV